MSEPIFGTRTVLLTLIVAILSAAGGFTAWRIAGIDRPPELQTLIVLPEPRGIPPFSLVDQTSSPFGPERLAGRWSLLFFGFTHCPDICPGTLYELQQVAESLRGEKTQAGPGHQVVFISVDPERDTPQRLGDYVAYFDPEFVAATGDHDQLQPLTRKLGIAYRIEEHAEGQASYNVDHSASVLLINPSGQLHGVFPAPHTAQVLAADMKAIMD